MSTAATVHWIENRRELELLANPLRHDIVDRLTALGPLSVGAIAAAVGCRPTAIYRHLQILQKGGLVVPVSATPQARGRPAQVYRAVADHVRFARAPNKPRNRATMVRIARSVATQAAKDYQAGFRVPGSRFEGTRRNQWFFRLFVAPSDARLARINALLEELMHLLWTPDPKPGRPISVAWFMSPVGKQRSPRAKRSAPRDPA